MSRRLETLGVFMVAALACFAIAARIDPLLVAPRLDDIWFESDMARNFQTLTDLHFDKVWPAKHPVFALLIWPLVSAAKLVTPDALTAVRVVLALNAGLFAIVLAHLLRADGAGRAERLAIVGVALASAGFWMWFTVPDTFGFGATSLLLGLTALAHDQQGRHSAWWRWVLASAAALAITVTNFAAAGIALAARLLLPPSPPLFPASFLRRIVASGAIMAAALTLVMAGSFVQNRVFPGTGYAFSPHALAQEQRFVGNYGSSPLGARLQTLLVAPVVMGTPYQRGTTGRDAQGQLASTLVVDGIWPATWLGRGAALLWLGLLGAGVAAVARPSTRSPLSLAALALLAVQVGLHLVYGELAFLYVAHLLPCALIVAARARLIIGRPAIVAAFVVLALTTVPGSRDGLDTASRIGGAMAQQLLS